MKRFISVSIAVFIFVSSAFLPFAAAEENEGKLDSFKEEVNETQSPPSTTSTEISSLDAQTVAVQGIMDILLSFFLMGLSQTGTEDFATLSKDLKAEWSPSLPTIRLEPSYQYLIGGLQGLSAKLEMGYLIIGIDGEYTRYFEKAPNDSLDIWQGHLLLRSIFTRYFHTNLALGVKSVGGGIKQTAFEFGLPFYIFITKHFIVDVLPYMATFHGKNMYDIGGGLSYKYKYVGLRAGYRAQFIGNEKLHGPRIGAFFQW